MATLFRLQKTKHNALILSGEGARIVGGRWNEQGTPLVYASFCSSLAILEMRVHLRKLSLLGSPPLTMATLEIPDEYIHVFKNEELPDDWDVCPETPCNREFLAPWLKSRKNLAYSVPSVVNPLERNILIDPLHSEINKVSIVRFDPFTFDSRLFDAGLVMAS